MFWKHIPALYKYFCIWNLALLVFHKYLYRYYNFILAYLIIVILSSIVFYRPPGGYLKVNYIDSSIPPTLIRDKAALLTLDVIFHWVPLAFVVILYGKYYSKNKYGIATLSTLVVSLIYVVYVDPSNVYDISGRELIVGLLIAFAAFIAIY